MVTAAVYSQVKRLYSSLQEMVGLRRRKRQLQISEPFNFKKEPTILPGLSEDEISVLGEKAAASRLGIAPADADTLLLNTPSPTAIHPRPPRMSSRPAGAGPLSLSPPPPPRLSIPMPIPIPVSNGGSRHGSSSSSRSGSSATTGTGTMRRGGLAAAERMSVSMNDLDLLLFGNPSGVGGGDVHNLDNMGGGGAAGTGKGTVMETALFRPVLPASATTASISPLELDATPAVSLGADWDMEFDFQLGSPVSPLSPASGGKKGIVGM